MSTYVKFQAAMLDLALGKHDFSSDELKVCFTNTAPDAAADAVLTDITQIAAANGYVAGGAVITGTGVSQTAGVMSLVGDDTTITASGGDFGPFRYAVVYNNTSATKPLLGYWDKGTSVTVTDGDPAIVDFTGAIYTAS